MLERMKIMAIDDNTVNLATIEQELKDKYDVIPMLTGRRAIKYLYRDKVDLILLDVQMPIMDGIETLKEIRTLEYGVTVPVVFLTSRKDTATVIAGSQLGIMDYITKPFDPADLKNRIEQVFKRLGVLPMEQEELYNAVADISRNIHEGNVKPAIAKTDEMLRYQIDEDISGRMRIAKKKLESGNLDQAQSAVDRVLTLLDRDMDDGSKNVYPPISLSEISARLLYTQDDIANFKLHDASDKLTGLRDFDIPESTHKSVNMAIEKLKEYDEDEAMEIIQEALEGLKDEMGKQHPQMKDEEASKASGYRAKYFNRNK